MTEIEIRDLLYRLPHRMIVEFAYFCAEDTRNNKDTCADACLDLVARWLKDESSVTHDELLYTAESVKLPFSNRHAAAYHLALCCTNQSAHHRVRCASYIALYAARDKGIYVDHYYSHLVDMVNNLSELEKLLYNIKQGDI